MEFRQQLAESKVIKELLERIAALEKRLEALETTRDEKI